MATQVRRRRGTSAEIAGVAPAEGEFFVNTDDNSIHVGDGAKLGGHKTAMAESLAADGGAALVGNAAISLDGVAELLSADWLQDGMTVSTGGTDWIITTESVNGLVLANGLFAHLNSGLNVKDMGAVGDGVAADTLPIQAAINLVYGLNGGQVFIPKGDYLIVASVEPDIFVGYDEAPFPATNGCIVHRAGVTLSGQSRASVTLQTQDQTKTAILVADALDSAIEDLSIHGVTSTAGGAAGVFNVNSESDFDNIRLTLRRLFITNFGGYGIGLNNGYMVNALVEDCETSFTGSDGIDAKSRSSDVNEHDIGNTITNFTARALGQRVTGACGVDLRGTWNVYGLTVRSFSSGVGTRWGIRLRPASEPNNYARYCNLTNIHIDCGGFLDTSGVNVDGVQCNVSNVTIVSPTIGMQFSGGSLGSTASNINTLEHSTYALFVGTNAVDLVLNNFVATDAAGAAAHFRIEGTGCTAYGFSGDESAPLFSVGSPAVDSFTQLGINASYYDICEIYQVLAGRAGIRAKGPSADIDIQISPKGSGLVRVGTHSAIAAETISGYITIKDASGVNRKVAIVS